MKFTLLTSLIIIILFSSCSPQKQSPAKRVTITEGFLDLSDISFDDSTRIMLKGKWFFYWEDFIARHSEAELPSEAQFMRIPGSWRKDVIGNTYPSTGYCSIKLNIHLKEEGRKYCLYVPDIGTAYELWVNGKFISAQGKVGRSRKAMIPQVGSSLVTFAPESKHISIVFHISNFNDFNGGPWRNIVLGTPEGINNMYEKFKFNDIFLFGALLITFFYQILNFLLHRENRSYLYFAVFIMMIALRTFVLDDRLVLYYFQNVPHTLVMRLEYLTFYISVPVFVLFISSLFKKHTLKYASSTITLLSSLFCIAVLVLDPLYFSSTVLIYQIYTLVCAFYIFFIIGKAAKEKDDGALILVAGFSMLIVTVINDVLVANQVIHTAYYLPIGLILFIVFQSFILTRRGVRDFRQAQALSNDLAVLNASYSKFLPTEFLSYLGYSSFSHIVLGDHVKKKMTILFSDIRSFTSISEQMSPDENFDFINEYLGLMGPVIRKNNGFIDKYIGDGIMALFPHSPDDAIRSAIEMEQALIAFNEKREASKLPKISVGIGIHTGMLMLGIVGESKRMEGTVISDAVNLTNRLEGITKDLGASIIVSEETLQASRGRFKNRFLGKVRVKGKSFPASVYEIFDADPPEVVRLKEETKDYLAQALNFYYEKKFQDAEDTFKRIVHANPNDIPARMYLEKSRELKINGSFSDLAHGNEREE